MDTWHSNVKNNDTASIDLENLFRDISSNQNELKTLNRLARNINFTYKLMNWDPVPLEKFRKSLDELFYTLEKEYPIVNSSSVLWEWDPSQKSPKIILSENNKKAHKESTQKVFSAVLGNLNMFAGRFRWEIETMGATDQNGLAFGIVEPTRVKSLEPINWVDAIWQSTNSNSNKLVKVRQLGDYKNKTYVCELDFDKDLFTVSHDGIIISEKRGGIKNNVFVPFVLLSYDQNAVRLRVLDSI